MSTDLFINCTPLEQLREFLKLQNENARLKIEIKLLNERLKAEEDKSSSRKPKKAFNSETLNKLLTKIKNYDRRSEIDEMLEIGQEIDYRSSKKEKK